MSMTAFFKTFDQAVIDQMRSRPDSIHTLAMGDKPLFKRETDLGYHWYPAVQILSAFKFNFGDPFTDQLDGAHMLDYLDAEEQAERIAHIDEKLTLGVLQAYAEQDDDEQALFAELASNADAVKEIAGQIRKISRFYAVAALDKQGVLMYIA